MNCDINLGNIQELLHNFSKSMYKATDSEVGSPSLEIVEKCRALLKLDYNITEINNRTGDLSTNYPSHIFIPENEINLDGCSTSTQQQTIYEQSFDATKFRELIKAARLARCRARFPVPVILFRGKYICRSSTLSGGAEIYTRNGFENIFGSKQVQITKDIENQIINEAVEVEESFCCDDTPMENSSIIPKDIKKNGIEWVFIDQVRHQDIRLIKYLNVGTIVDFMVENKKVKYGMNVTSSEKIDKEKRYSDFTIISLPYPGCEFFKLFRDNSFCATGLQFNWAQAQFDAKIFVPEDASSNPLPINWEQYQSWDLITMTQNYLKVLLKYLQENSNGLLVHCISGWDRTPLFVSLLRISLWADGTIHQSLSAVQVLFLTISYDWYLFGHNFPDRLAKGEEILFFCFYVLKFLHDEDYSIYTPRRNNKNSVSSNGSSSSISVIRTDSDIMLDSLLLDGESITGSNLSINSFGSSRSQADSNHLDVFENFNGNNGFTVHNQDSNHSGNSIGSISELTNGNSNVSPSMRRTSPVSVPISGNARQRNESFSSVNGSWQMISTTGSLRSPEPQHLPNQPRVRNNSNNMTSQESSSATVVDDDSISNTSEQILMRRARLHQIRSIFYQCYFATIGIQRDETIGAFFNNFVGRVGLAPKIL